MGPRGHKHLRPTKRLRKLLAFLRRHGVFQLRQILTLFFLDVLGEVLHQRPDSRLELRVRGFHVLEFFQLFFNLHVALVTDW